MSGKLHKRYKKLRKAFPGEEYAFLFQYIPGLENLDQEIAEEQEAEERQRIQDLKGDYWNLASFIFGKLKKERVFRKWCRAQLDCQFDTCPICNSPIEHRKAAAAHHLVPLKELGTNYSGNLCIVHEKCYQEDSPIELDLEKYQNFKQNSYNEKLDQKVEHLTAKYRDDYPVELPDRLFDSSSKK